MVAREALDTDALPSCTVRHEMLEKLRLSNELRDFTVLLDLSLRLELPFSYWNAMVCFGDSWVRTLVNEKTKTKQTANPEISRE